MSASMSADHRVGDGAEANVYVEVQSNLENPKLI